MLPVIILIYKQAPMNLIGSYKLIKKIGEGISGIVYKVEKNSEM